jgi:hypothetical protein
MLIVTFLIVMPSVVILSVVILSVMVPQQQQLKQNFSKILEKKTFFFLFDPSFFILLDLRQIS